MTSEELFAHLERSYAVLRRQPDAVVLGWKLGADVQTQHLEVVTAFGAPWIRIACPAGARGLFSAEAALAHNLTLAIGALALESGSYRLRHLAPLDSLTPALLDQALELTAHEAARLRTGGLVGRSSGNPSTHFAD